MEKKTDLRIIKTYKALSDTFLTMLGEKKFEDITVNELCERAMVRRATFYKHFADKYEFLGFFIRQTQDEFVAALDSTQLQEDYYSYYLYLFQKCINFLNLHQQLMERIMESNVFPTLLSIFSEEIYRHVLLKLKEDTAKGLYLPMSAEVLASFYTGGITQVLGFWFKKNPSMTEDELIAEVELVLKSFSFQS